MLGEEVEITFCDVQGTKKIYKFTEVERMSFVLFGVLHASRCNNFHAAFNDAMVHAGWYDQATTKNSRQIIKEHEGFFDGLSDIDTVIVIGHSLSEVDMEYFEKICSEIHSDAKWIFSCHDSAGLKAINAFVKTMTIGADRVTLFRL